MRFARVICSVLALAVACLASSGRAQEATPTGNGAVTAVVTGLTNPRGFIWDDDGTLYVALAGTGGDTPGTIDGVEDGIFGGQTASIVTIEAGCAVPFVEELRSGNWRDAGWIWGAHDIALLGGELYILSAGGGADFGNPDEPAGVLRVEADGTASLVADFTTWSIANPPAFVAPDYSPSGSLFDMESDGERLWITDAVGGRIITVTPDGKITLVADISDGHPVPTGIALAPEGGVYVGSLTAIPYPDGSAKVVHVAEDGAVTDVWTGLTAVNDIAVGPDGALYAVEMATGNVDEPPFIQPGTGRIVRMTGPDGLDEVVTGIDYPVYLGFDGDGALYLTTPGFAPNDGAGQGALLRINISGEGPVSLSGQDLTAQSCLGSAAATPDA